MKCEALADVEPTARWRRQRVLQSAFGEINRAAVAIRSRILLEKRCVEHNDLTSVFDLVQEGHAASYMRLWLVSKHEFNVGIRDLNRASFVNGTIIAEA